MPLSTINLEQRLYVIEAGAGFTCLGFDVAYDKTLAIAEHYKRDALRPPAKRGTEAAYAAYRKAVDFAQAHFTATGRKCPVELSPQLMGLEGKRVEVEDKYGNRRRFIVGKSGGWIPCHLEIANRRQCGGHAADREYKSVQVIG